MRHDAAFVLAANGPPDARNRLIEARLEILRRWSDRRRRFGDAREPEIRTDLDRFAVGLRVAGREGERRPTHSRPYRRREPVPRRPSMPEDLDEQIRIRVAEEPGVTGVEILRRIKALQPHWFTNKHARTVQRTVAGGR
jgi:hypothetical protein